MAAVSRNGVVSGTEVGHRIPEDQPGNSASRMVLEPPG
jgi:hypothetical protein